jgi:hypothetical protein
VQRRSRLFSISTEPAPEGSFCCTVGCVEQHTAVCRCRNGPRLGSWLIQGLWLMQLIVSSGFVHACVRTCIVKGLSTVVCCLPAWHQGGCCRCMILPRCRCRCCLTCVHVDGRVVWVLCGAAGSWFFCSCLGGAEFSPCKCVPTDTRTSLAACVREGVGSASICSVCPWLSRSGSSRCKHLSCVMAFYRWHLHVSVFGTYLSAASHAHPVLCPLAPHHLLSQVPAFHIFTVLYSVRSPYELL